MKIKLRFMSLGSALLLAMTSVAHAITIGSTLRPGEMLTIDFGFDSAPSMTPAGVVDGLRFSAGMSLSNFFGSSYLNVELFDGSSLLATKRFFALSDYSESLGSCCNFVQPGSAGTSIATINADLDSLAAGTIVGRLQLTPVWDDPIPGSVASIAWTLDPVRFVAYNSFWFAEGLQIRSVTVTPVVHVSEPGTLTLFWFAMAALLGIRSRGTVAPT